MKFDAIIIGFGKAGKTLAGTLAKQGKKVALIEKSTAMYGGTCINVGCIPSKSLVTSAAAVAAHSGLPFAKKAAMYADAVAERERVTTMLRGKNYDKLAALDNVTIFDGMGSFVSAHEVAVDTAAGRTVLQGEKIFINTGSTPVLPPIDGLSDCPYVYTSETLMRHPVLPQRLAIIGSGYIGVEFASMYASFGSEVIIIQDGEVFLPREDRDMADAILAALAAKGVQLIRGAAVQSIHTEDNTATVLYSVNGENCLLAAQAVLVATGRQPNTDGLHAENADVQLTPRGAVQVDDLLRTTAPNIWAMGDVAGGLQFTYISLDDYRIVSAQLRDTLGHAANTRGPVAYSVFMDPPFARVGMSEAEAQKTGLHYKAVTMPAAAVPKAQVLRKTQGLLKAIVDTDTNKILGVSLLCAESHETINTVQLAMRMGADYTVLRDNIYTHPTMTEALNDLFALV